MMTGLFLFFEKLDGHNKQKSLVRSEVVSGVEEEVGLPPHKTLIGQGT